LCDLLSKEVPFEWGEAQEKSFQDLKQALLLPPILRLPDVSRPFHLQIDASLQGLSYVLGQTDDDGRKYVVSYGGRGLRLCEKKWSITQLECVSLLIVKAVRGILMRGCANLYKSMKTVTLVIFDMLCLNLPRAKANSQWCRHIRQFKMAAARNMIFPLLFDEKSHRYK